MTAYDPTYDLVTQQLMCTYWQTKLQYNVLATV